MSEVVNLQKEVRKRTENPGFFRKNFYMILAFAIPFILMCIAFRSIDIYPFALRFVRDASTGKLQAQWGSQQIMVVDSWHQYFPFLNELHEKLKSGDSLFYSWHIGGGTNFLALIAYYASSPMNLLTLIWPKQYLTEFMAFFTVIKISLSGLTLSIFLKSMYKRSDLSTVAFSVLYALSAFAMGYYWTWMWLDGVLLFPLVILGLNKLIDEGKYKLFVFSLALTLISNYYIGAFVCIFVALYYIVAYLSRYSITDIRNLSRITNRVVLFSIFGVALSLIIVLPTYFALSHASAASNTFPSEVSFYKPWIDMFNDLLTGVGPNRQKMQGTINIGCGMLSVMLFFVYMFNKKINYKERIAHCLLLVFIFFTFNINVLDYLMHGMHFPNELPHRYAFAFSFFLIIMAYRAFVSIKSYKYSNHIIIGSMFAIVIYTLFANKMYDGQMVPETSKLVLPPEAVVFTILFTILYAIALLLFVSEKRNNLIIMLVICFLAVGEGYIASQNGVKETGSSGRSDYLIGKEDTEELAYIMNNENPNDFFRIENNKTYTINPGALYSFNGISQFNSSCNSRAASFMEKIGFAGNAGSNRYTYSMTTPVNNSFFNIKYIINRNGTTESEFFKYYKQSGGATGYEYEYYLPLGFMVDKSTRLWNTLGSNPFDTQNSLIKNTTKTEKDVLTEMPLTDSYYSNMDVTENGTSFSYSSENSGVQGDVTLTYTAERDGTAYAYIKTYRAVDRQASYKIVSEKDGSGITATDDLSYSHIYEIGECKKGELIEISFSLEAAGSGSFDSMVYMFDENAFKTAYEKLKEEPLVITEYSSTKIKGTVDCSKDSLLYTSIFYEEGWKAKVGGKEVKIVPLNDSLIALDLTAGKHDIEFYYTPEGFNTGLTVSAVSLFLMLLLTVLEKCKVKVPYLSFLLSNEEPEKPQLVSAEAEETEEVIEIYPNKMEVQLPDEFTDDTNHIIDIE